MEDIKEYNIVLRKNICGKHYFSSILEDYPDLKYYQKDLNIY